MLQQFPALQRYGMDISQGYLEVSKAAGIDVCYSRLEDMPYHANTFDIIVCTDVLEHVLDLHRCCERLLDVLKDSGVLIVRVPVYEDLSRYLDPAFPYDMSTSGTSMRVPFNCCLSGSSTAPASNSRPAGIGRSETA